MKPIYSLSILALASFTSLSAMANNHDSLASDTIVDVSDARRIILTEQDSVINLSIVGSADDPNYKFSYTKALGDQSESLVTEAANKWDFTFGFQKNKKTGHISRNTFNIGGIGFGFVTALNAPAGMDVKMASFYEIFTDIFGYSHHSKSGHHVYSVAFGLNWRNYRMTGTQRFVKGVNNVTITDYPEGAEIDFSRIKVFSLTVPFSYTYRFNDDFNIKLSAILNFNTYASIKTRYVLNGEKKKEIYKNIHQTPVSVDFRLGFNWKEVGIYAKYSPCKVLDTTYGPSFQGFSTGFTFLF